MAYTRLLGYTAPGSVHARGLGAGAPHAAKRQEWQRMLASVADFAAQTSSGGSAFLFCLREGIFDKDEQVGFVFLAS